MRRKVGWVLLFVLILALLPGSVAADGIIIPIPRPTIVPEPPMLDVAYHRVEVTIEDQVAVTHVDQVFVNPYEYEVEGTYVFPLPLGASLSSFAMWVDGERVEAELLPAEEARQIYEEIVRQRRDPALLEYIGRQTVRARIFPIPPGGERRVEIEYVEVLPLEEGRVRYVYPLDTERFSAEPIDLVNIHVTIRSSEPIKAIYSPTHPVAIARDGEYRAEVGYEASEVLPDTDFELVYTLSTEQFGLHALSYREGEEDGYFLLLIAPPLEVEGHEAVPKDVILVLDTSGSMEGEKLEQAQRAVCYVTDHLNPEDRFNVIVFSTGTRRYAKELRPASEGEDACRWASGLAAMGGTNIHAALLEAIADAEDRPTLLIFLTDGLATEGVVETDQILRAVSEQATDQIRLFTFGVGDEVNTILLDTLARDHRGASAYVRPGEAIDERVSAFYAKVQAPVLTGLELGFGSIWVEDLYPSPLPDLFAGSQLIVAGRYREGGTTTVTLRGVVDGEVREFRYPEVNFVDQGGFDTIPRVWATRKIGYLLDQIRLHGEDPELVDAIVDLAVRYGIVTPYTSFLVQEDVDLFSEEGREQISRELMAAPAEEPAWGAEAVKRSVEQNALRNAETVSQARTEEVRVVGEKVFLLRDDEWVDTVFDAEEMVPQEVEFLSEGYFRLLEEHPEWGRYLSVGDRLVVVLDGVAYRVLPSSGNEPGTQVTSPPPSPTSTPRPTSTSSPSSGPMPTSTPVTGTEAAEMPVCSTPFALLVLVIAAAWVASR